MFPGAEEFVLALSPKVRVVSVRNERTSRPEGIKQNGSFGAGGGSELAFVSLTPVCLNRSTNELLIQRQTCLSSQSFSCDGHDATTGVRTFAVCDLGLQPQSQWDSVCRSSLTIHGPSSHRCRSVDSLIPDPFPHPDS